MEVGGLHLILDSGAIFPVISDLKFIGLPSTKSWIRVRYISNYFVLELSHITSLINYCEISLTGVCQEASHPEMRCDGEPVNHAYNHEHQHTAKGENYRLRVHLKNQCFIQLWQHSHSFKVWEVCVRWQHYAYNHSWDGPRTIRETLMKQTKFNFPTCIHVQCKYIWSQTATRFKCFCSQNRKILLFACFSADDLDLAFQGHRRSNW